MSRPFLFGSSMKKSEVAPEQYEKLLAHLNLVIEANKRTNLTRINTPEEGELLHIEDSIAGLDELNAAPAGKYADLGTGGGFPGIPLAILSGRKTVLVDTRYKKTEALDDIIAELGVSDQVTTYTGRIELMALEQKGQYAAITARALAKLSVLMELASPLLKKGGYLICYKSHVEDDEMNHALELQQTLNMKKVSDRSFYLSDGETFRRIIVFEKLGNARIKLPRHDGFAQKKPL